MEETEKCIEEIREEWRRKGKGKGKARSARDDMPSIDRVTGRQRCFCTLNANRERKGNQEEKCMVNQMKGKGRGRRRRKKRKRRKRDSIKEKGKN